MQIELQTVKTLIRLLSKEQSDLDLLCFPRPVCQKNLDHYGIEYSLEFIFKTSLFGVIKFTLISLVFHVKFKCKSANPDLHNVLSDPDPHCITKKS